MVLFDKYVFDLEIIYILNIYIYVMVTDFDLFVYYS